VKSGSNSKYMINYYDYFIGFFISLNQLSFI